MWCFNMEMRMLEPSKRLSKLQLYILDRLLHSYRHIEATGDEQLIQSVYNTGIRLEEILGAGQPTRSQSASDSRALKRLEQRGLILRNSIVSGTPSREGRLRGSVQELPPRRTDAIILLPPGRSIAEKRLTI